MEELCQEDAHLPLSIICNVGDFSCTSGIPQGNSSAYWADLMLLNQSKVSSQGWRISAEYMGVFCCIKYEKYSKSM